MSYPKPWTKEWLKGKTLADLGAIEHGGRLLFPDVVRRARASGTWDEIPILVRVPLPRDKREARIEAIAYMAKHKLDRDKDADLFEEQERLALLARIMHDRADPYDRHVLDSSWFVGDKPGEGYDLVSLYDVWNRVQLYQSMIDPTIAEEEVSTEVIVQAALGVADSGNLSPFAGMHGLAQDACVIGMAKILASYLRGSSSSPSPGTSTPES